MFVKRKKVDNVQGFTHLNNFCLKDYMLFSINENLFKTKIKNVREIFSFGEGMIVRNLDNGSSFILNDKGEVVKENLKIEALKFPYFTFYSIDSEDKEGIYNYKTQEILFETTDWIGRDIIGDYIFSDYKGLITARKVTSVRPIWQFNLNKLAPPHQGQSRNENDSWSVNKFIGILENKIWIALNHYTLIGLDLQSGQLIHQLSEISGFDYPYGSIIPEPSAMHIDTKRNTIIGQSWEYYWEINPNSGCIVMYPLNEYFLSLRLRNDLPNYSVFIEEENRLFFVSRSDGLRFDSQLACLDINSRKIIWKYKFEPDDIGKVRQPNGLKGNSDKIGVLDKKNTLHIFEKQDQLT